MTIVRSGNSGLRFPSSLLAASVQNYFMPLLNEELGSHSAKLVGRTGDEYACHYFLPLYYKFRPIWTKISGLCLSQGSSPSCSL